MSSQSHVSHCRVLPLGEFTVMIPQPHATLQGAVTWRNQCHDRATLQGVIIPSAILKIIFRQILFIFVFFKCSLGFNERRLSYRLRYTCYSILWSASLSHNIMVKLQPHQTNFLHLSLDQLRFTMHIQRCSKCCQVKPGITFCVTVCKIAPGKRKGSS